MNTFNTKNLTKLLSLLFIPLLFTACYANFDDYDADTNGMIEQEEFNDYFDTTNYYEGWDVDDDGYLSDEELYSGTFGAIDNNNDNYIDENEYETATYFLTDYVDNDYGTFDEWDDDDDGMLDENEFMNSVDEVGFFDSWDINDDGLLADNELQTGLFDSWDTDDNGVIDEDEYGFYEDGLFE